MSCKRCIGINECTGVCILLDAYICQVSQGVSEFKATSKNYNCFKCSYNVEHTLLVSLMLYALELVLEVITYS